MAAPQNFRSAFNGFNRDDVVNYIAYITNKNETQVNQLNNDVARLQQERDELQQQVQKTDESSSKLELICQELAGLKEQLIEREQRVQELEAELEKERAKEKTVVSAAAPAPKDAVRLAEELNAYRRAESVERRAREQVNQMFDQACGTLADTSVSLENTTGRIAELEEQILQNLAQLQTAMAESKTELANAAVSIAAIRPEQG